MRIAALILALSMSVEAQEDLTLDRVVQRMRAYLADYAGHLTAVIATEKYQQRVGSGMRRNQRVLVSEYGLVQVPGNSEWLGFREVLTVDGKPVADSARRLADLLAKPSPRAVAQARRIADESARYNIGPITRTINDPALVLDLLDGRHGQRVTLSKNGEATIGATRVWILRFEETGRPTIIATRDEKELPAQGRAWIEPESGRILRAQAIVEPGFGVTGTLDVTFDVDARLGFAVPSKMTERYTNRNLVTVSSGEATYSNYRRFTVDTDENILVK